MLKKGSIFDNRYELIRLLGRGGFSEVWLVKDTLVGLDEALKVYAPGGGMDEDGLKVFAQELSVVHNLRHTNLLTPKILWQYQNQPYLILPYCPNGSLNRKVGKCTEEEAWKILEQVASGLAYLHEHKIIHQDIKPDNILVDENNDYVITDFGISMKAQSTLRKSMRVQANSGTMAYMAPERFSENPLPTKASDMWSLGAMLFELVEGTVPFDQFGGGKQQGGAKIPTMRADVSDALKQVINSLLAKDVADRPTAKQVVELARKREGAATPAKEGKAKPVIERKTQPIVAQPFPPVDEHKTQRIEPIVATPEKKELPKEEKPQITDPQKRKKRIIIWSIAAAVLLAVGLIIGMIVLGGSKKSGHAIVEEHVLIDGLYYDLYADNTAKVVELRWTSEEERLYKGLSVGQEIPSSVQYKSDSYAVTNIGFGAFQNSPLSFITIPNSVTYIDAYAFADCPNLTSVTLPNSVTYIGELAFEGSGITEPVYNQHVFAYLPRSYSGAYTIPKGIKQIAGCAFQNCSKLTSVTIPNSVTSIGTGAFGGCHSLQLVSIPNSVTEVGCWAFMASGIYKPVYNRHVFAYLPPSYSGAYSVPVGIEKITCGAFDDCTGLTTLKLPKSVTTIEGYAFEGCKIKEPVYNQHVFAYMPRNYTGEYTIPDGIEQIADYAFCNCTGLTSVTIPNSVTNIGDYAFMGCSNLKSIAIPKHTQIGYDVFERCEKVKISYY